MARRKHKNRFLAGTALTTAIVILISALTGMARRCSDNSPGLKISTPLDALLHVEMPDSVSNSPVKHYSAINIAFNPRHHIPNYVSWILTRDMVNGTIPRENKFYTDPRVKGCASPDDYKYSGYDRGHMAPAGDMKWCEEAMHESFSMANMCPQAKPLNTGAWKRLEEKCRQWAEADSAIVIVCGPILTREPEAYIGATHVSAPSGFFKVILSPGSNPPRAIGFIMPNAKVPGGIQQAAVSVDSVERATGFDFFAALPDSIESIVESQCDFHYWSTIRPKKN